MSFPFRQRGIQSRIAEKLGVHRSTISRDLKTYICRDLKTYLAGLTSELWRARGG
jgi:hypothetical protein